MTELPLSKIEDSYQENTKKQKKEKSDYQLSWLDKTIPWMAGAGIAIGHIITSSNCTVPQQGRCSTCGGCVVALGSLTAWAILKNRKEGGYYTDIEK